MPTIVTDPDLLAQLNAPDRAPVPSTSRVVGDAEAEAKGLYEPIKRGGVKPVTDPNILRQLNTSDSGIPHITVTPMQRFGEMETPANVGELDPALRQRALEMTRGPTVPPAVQMATDVGNVLTAASQGTDPNVSRYGGRVVSTEVFQDDAGNIQYRDPQTKEIRYTDNTKQVALYDPQDKRLKIFERSPETEESAAVGVARVLAPGLGAGAVTRRPMIPIPSKVQPRASEVFQTAKPFYRAFEQEASQLQAGPDVAANLAGRIRGALEQSNFIEELAKPVYSAVGILEKGKPITLEALQKVKRVVGKSFSSPDKNVRDAAAVASAEIGRIISEISPSAAQNLKTADEIHATARAVQDLQRKSAVADLRKGRAGYGGNAVNAMRQVLSPIVQRAVEGRSTGFKPNEIAAMREIVEGTATTNVARGLGQLSPSKGIIQTLGAVGTGGGTAVMAGGPVGAAVGLAIPTIGMVSNKIATVLTGKQIDRLKELVTKRSPAYAEAVKKAAERWDRTQAELLNDPSPNRFAAYLSASRAFSSGLIRDGIQVSSGDLLKAIRGPMQAPAEGEQPAVPGVPGQ